MIRANNDIRTEARRAGVPLWALAHEIGVSEATMTRQMRFELHENEKVRFRAAIKAVAQRRESETHEDAKNR